MTRNNSPQPSSLNAYHKQRSKEAVEAVKAMMKIPKSYEEMRQVIHKSLYED